MKTIFIMIFYFFCLNFMFKITFYGSIESAKKSKAIYGIILGYLPIDN